MPNVKFEDVYLNRYVQDSMNYLVAFTVKRYPMLASCREDLEQELWIALFRKLHRFRPEKSSLNRFCRVVLDASLKEVRRKFFSRRCITERTSMEITREMEDSLVSNDSEKTILALDIQSVLQSLPPEQKTICEMLMDGFTIRQVAARLHTPVGSLYKHQIADLQEIFLIKGLKK